MEVQHEESEKKKEKKIRPTIMEGILPYRPPDQPGLLMFLWGLQAKLWLQLQGTEGSTQTTSSLQGKICWETSKEATVAAVCGVLGRRKRHF